MLQTLMEMKLFVYSMVGVGVFTVLVMLILNKVSAKNVQDKESYFKVARRFKTTAVVGSVICLVLTGVNTFGTFKLSYDPVTRYGQMALGVGIILGLFILQKLFCFLVKESFTSDFVFANLEEILNMKSRDKPIISRDLKALDKTLVVDRFDNEELDVGDSMDAIEQGIKETAASTSKYGTYLTPEEEEIMRDVIRQYMSC